MAISPRLVEREGLKLYVASRASVSCPNRNENIGKPVLMSSTGITFLKVIIMVLIKYRTAQIHHDFSH